MTALVVWGKVPPTVARVNWGRWIADCTVCPSALAVIPGTPAFECWDCGARVEVLWPGVDLQAGIERLLSMRPDPNTRNWSAGETLHDLMRENAEHGIFSHPALDGIVRPGEELLAVSGDRIVVDLLPATRELTVPRRRFEIGA